MGAEALVASLALTAIGTGTQIYAAKEGADAQKEQIAAQQRAEMARKQGLEIDIRRKQREQIRSSIIARSQALSSATARGAEESSILPGAYGQIAGQTAFNLAGTNLERGLGEELFAASQQGLAGKRAEASAGALSATGAGISSLGGAIGKNISSVNSLFGSGTLGIGKVR